MLIKWGSIVTDGRGKLGGQVYSRNRTGAYARNKVTPVNPRTSFQIAARSLLANFSSAWRALTQAQRDAWEAAVSNWQKTNVFGDIVEPTGKNLYTKLNVNLDLIGEPAIQDPPVPVSVVEPVIEAVSLVGGTFTVTTDTATPATGQSYLLYATEPVSPGKSFVKNLYRLVGEITIVSGTPTDIAADYVARLGTPVAGMKICVKIVPVVDATGQKGLGSEMCAIAS